MIQKSILIVEDERSLRSAIADLLHRRNFVPLIAKNGKEGVALAFSKHPDIILLDLIMPVMDGVTAFNKIREDSWGTHVPIIIFTNMSEANPRFEEDIAAHKPTEYVLKSNWKIYDVVNRIEEIVA